jgi:hypothetical protein
MRIWSLVGNGSLPSRSTPSRIFDHAISLVSDVIPHFPEDQGVNDLRVYNGTTRVAAKHKLGDSVKQPV